MAAKPFIVTLDGPAGVGKTTLARSVAEKLGVAYLDTGAMFRTLGLNFGQEAGRTDAAELAERARGLRFELSGSGAGTVLYCNGKAVGPEIRTEEVGMLAARVGAVPEIREVLKEQQRRLGKATSLVAEGRDMGTVVFPDAPCKFFLDASPEVRAGRRLKDLEKMGQHVEFQELVREIRERDDMDRNRAVAPLKPADDAVIIDTSDLDINGVLAAILEKINV